MYIMRTEAATRRLWVTWEVHRRSREVSARLGATLCEVVIAGGRPLRYLRCLWRTARLLARSRGTLVFVQSPSIVLAWFAATTAKLFGVTVVVDAHNGGVEPLDGRSRILNAIARAAIRRSALTIVTNSALARRVESMGGVPFVLVDPIPRLPALSMPMGKLPGVVTVVAISTWAQDEPTTELLAAAARLPSGYKLQITGRHRLSSKQLHALPANVRLTSFVPEEAYVQLLRNADLIIDLTTREDCLVCGSYEALAIGKPLVVSDTRALRQLLGNGAVYCRNNANDIAAAVVSAMKQVDELADAAVRRATELEQEWRVRCVSLEARLQLIRNRDET
jgi:glycosyltransferase involved in cell wall biosynthesis